MTVTASNIDNQYTVKQQACVLSPAVSINLRLCLILRFSTSRCRKQMARDVTLGPVSAATELGTQTCPPIGCHVSIVQFVRAACMRRNLGAEECHVDVQQSSNSCFSDSQNPARRTAGIQRLVRHVHVLAILQHHHSIVPVNE
jgi:hypothetical protein